MLPYSAVILSKKRTSRDGGDAPGLQWAQAADRLGQEINLRRGAHVADNMADAAAITEGDVKGVQAVAEASGQIEH